MAYLNYSLIRARHGLARAFAFAIGLQSLVMASLAYAQSAPTTFTPSANCSLSAAAFCETFDEGPAAVGGRGGDLDPKKWSTARLSGEIGSSGYGTANPVPVAPIPQCRAGITQTSVFPPNDTLICDPSGTRSSQLMTAVAMQNYGVNSYMVRQPFDFAGRTGTIHFDVDAVAQNLGGFIELELTQDPSPATTFREFQNFEVGPVPRNGLTLRLSTFPECPTSVAPLNTFIYNNYVGTIVAPTYDHVNGCAATQFGSLNHFEVQVSQNSIAVYGSDFSTDNGKTFPNYKLLYTANINLPFTRGYVHFNPRNHATVKYGVGPDVVYHWDNIGFDGPVVPVPSAYEIPNNTTTSTYNGPVAGPVQNLGYQLLNGTTGIGIYSPTTKINALTFQNVNIAGITSATLTLNAFFNTVTHTPDTTWGIQYRFNGGTWRNYNFTAGDLADINAVAGAPLGFLSWSLDVPTSDVVSGTNTLELVPLNAPMDFPPVVANIDLLLGTTGTVTSPPATPPTVAFSASPTNISSGQISMATWSSTNASSCTGSGGWSGPKDPSGTLAVAPKTTTTYMLACSGAGGTSPTASTTVAVGGAPPVAINGMCGSANGIPASSAPSANLCSAGTSSSVAGSGPWTWSCGGANGGTGASCSASVLVGSGSGSGSGSTSDPTPTPVSGNCSMQLGGSVAFCETFDKKNSGSRGRTGDLDPNVWGVSRATGNVNYGRGQYNGWAATQLQTCNGTTTVTPPNDIMICNGQLREASNDNPTGVYEAGTVTTLAMFPKQPFDFSGRTGTVSFDVSNDSHGTSATWPEFWMSNLPVPTPFNHYDSWQALPQNGFGIRFGAAVAPGGWGSCGNGNNLDKRRWTVDSAVVVRNYVMDDTNGIGGVRTNMAVKQLDCVISPPDNSGIMNHIELKISQNQIDVYATDAGVAASPSTLRHIAVITNANLALTRGLISLEDVHFNADAAESSPNVPSQRQHTFVWDNVAFDGPFTYRDFSYDALDVEQADAATHTLDLGKISGPNQTASWNVLSIPANPTAESVRVVFNFYEYYPFKTLNVAVNGHAHSVPWPYPDTKGFTWKTFAVTIPTTDLVPGTNVVTLGSDQAMVTSNVSIVLLNVPGGVPVLPGSNNAYPSGGSGNVPLPTVAFSASPTGITSGQISMATWNSTNASSCNAGGGWTGPKATSGTLAVSPPTTTTYTLACTGTGGTSPMASATVAVNAAPVAISGVCGSANATQASSAPSTNLCSAGTSSSVAGSGPWTWSCGGSNGGSTASCSASVLVASGSGSGSGSGSTGTGSPTPVSGNCSMQLGGAVAFCETFDQKNPGIQSRTGDLDPNVWGVSRAGQANFGQGTLNGWALSTQLQTCGGTTAVTPPNDVVICNGQLREASNDNPTGVFEAGTVTTLAMYPKQPFDFAGRTGTVSFDVSNDSHGIHAVWPEFWMSDLPVPAPFNHFGTWQALPQNGFGIRFGAAVVAGQYGSCPNGNNLSQPRWTVDSAVVVRNYVMDDTVGIGGVRTNMAVQQLDCVISSPDNSGIMNHVELKISQSQIDVYATDAGVAPSPSTLRHIAVITNANLTLTRGLIWLEDVHYNADKGAPPSQKQHTFVWDNVAFDGPFTYRDFSYDALDINRPDPATSTTDLGQISGPNQTASWNVLNLPANPTPAAVRVLFNFYEYYAFTTLNVTVNGHAHSVPWPYPDQLGFTWKTFAVTIPVTDLVPGTNVVQIGSDQTMITSNVNIVLADVPGGVPVLPGSNNAYPSGGAPSQ
ncbi:hypothetical protein [Bradyrhizobium erythrophlei]|uniref:Uncharacterized protein n=1 Tax=Bradyrhizobium erythrophlei TaxID=1437360 RepID=A0A1M7UY33_9BRAD|nr:hypothetical protein [Bradyrhizobium erythrophlei]SHN87826.1 hypothetical protein SAMN05444170_7392 [Bradyrhizobium erythrophlei]